MTAPLDLPGAAYPDRRARVLAVVEVGRRIADPRDPLGVEARDRLPSVTGLTPESVELALTEHLETHVTEADLTSLLSRARLAPRCHVVLSANVCTAALRAIAVAVATSPSVLVKPSRRDPVLAELIAGALSRDAAFLRGNGRISLTGALTPRSGDEVHAYGSDETMAAIRTSLVPGAVLRAHGAGMGVAVIEAGADIELAASELARDVIAFDQRGCLSPRAALVAGGGARAALAARALSGALSALERRAPRAPLDADTRAALARYCATAQALGACHAGPGHVVGLDEAPSALVLPPAARAVHVMPATPDEASRWLAPWGAKIAALGFAGAGEVWGAALRAAPHARTSPVGRMQRPPLDGPVDLRAIEVTALTYSP